MFHRKQQLRDQMIARRATLSDADRRRAGEVLAERIANLPAFATAERIFTYAHFGTELPTDALWITIMDAGKQLVLPVVVGDGVRLVITTDPAIQLTPGLWGIPEPSPDDPGLSSQEVDLFLLPGLAFSANGGRLGYGKGYMDRMLEDTNGARLGVAFDFQVVPQVPCGPQDQTLDGVVTPDRTILCAGGGLSTNRKGVL